MAAHTSTIGGFFSGLFNAATGTFDRVLDFELSKFQIQQQSEERALTREAELRRLDARDGGNPPGTTLGLSSEALAIGAAGLALAVGLYFVLK